MNTALAEPPAPEQAASQEQLDAILLQHGRPLRFADRDITEANLRGMDLSECEFVRCRGGRADFSACDLSETSSHLSGASFQDCKLTGMLIYDARTLGLRFTHCLLMNARLPGLSFRKEQLEGLNFQGADLAAVDFREAILTDCDLREAHVTQARFEGADLRGAQLGPLHLTDAARFKGAIISRHQAADLLSGFGLIVA
jgi:fluoroquinolone resistance protein